MIACIYHALYLIPYAPQARLASIQHLSRLASRPLSWCAGDAVTNEELICGAQHAVYRHFAPLCSERK